MPDKDARREMDSLRKSDRVDGAVLGGYTTTRDRWKKKRTRKCIDFVVYWPKDIAEPRNLCSSARLQEKKGKPTIRTPILCRFGDLFRDLAQQFGNITLDD